MSVCQGEPVYTCKGFPYSMATRSCSRKTAYWWRDQAIADCSNSLASSSFSFSLIRAR